MFFKSQRGKICIMTERKDLTTTQPDMRIIIPVAAFCAVGGLIGSTAALEFSRQSGVVSTELLNPPISYLLQFSATGCAALVGIGVGFSVAKLISEGEI